jgi:hypothetical protein
MPDERNDAEDDGLRIVRFDDIHDLPPVSRTLGYEDVVARNGHRFDEIAAGIVGFDRAGAAAAIEALRNSSLAITAIEAMQSASKRPLYALQRWNCDRLPSEPFAQFRPRSLELAEGFLTSFPDPEDGTVMYVLVTAPDETAPARG